MISLFKPVAAAGACMALLSGCGSLLNTAGSGDYGCPGMPTGVLCKTPAAVYKSTHLDPEPTAFDMPIGKEQASPARADGAPRAEAAMPLPGIQVKSVSGGPRPVREPARVARIWIAPWVDKQDNLHLAQIHYTEIKPRTWTVGKPEVAAGSSYVIPHRAFDKIAAAEPRPEPAAPRAAQIEQPGAPPAVREAEALEPPPN